MTVQATKDWLIEKIAEETGVQISDVHPDEPFDSFNMDSLSVVSISYDLENFSGKTVDPTIFGEYKTINQLVNWLEKQ